MLKNKSARALLRTSALVGTLSLVLISSQALAQSPTYTFDIPSEALSTALHDFARVSGQQIIFTPEQVAGKTAAQLKGKYTVDEALAQLLAGTNLVVDHSSSAGLMVQSKNVQAASNDGAALSGPGDIETVVVTGTNIRGIDVLPAEMRSIDRSEIANGGFASIDQVLASIPQNFTDLTPSTGTVRGASGPSNNNAFDRASSIDLRGLGSDSTLVLVNGERRPGATFGYVTDLSGIPVSAIDRIDVVTGGESSIYGADAVAGVVNVITRRSFSGMETNVYAGLATRGGGDRVQFDQTVGVDKADWGFVLAYDYTKDSAVDLAQRGLTKPGTLSVANYYVDPDTTSQSILLSGHYELTNALSAYFDGAYHFFQGAGLINILIPASNLKEFEPQSLQHGEYDYSGGLKYRLNSWTFDLSGNYGLYRDATNASLVITNAAGATILSTPSIFHTQSTLAAGRFVAEGSLPNIFGIEPRAAVGAEVRSEYINAVKSTQAFPYDAGKRDVQSGFVELYLPIVAQGSPWLRRLDLSLSGRYDHYSDFGDTTNFLVGTVWQPSDDLTLKASYSTAFRPPALSDLNHPPAVILSPVPDPMSATGTSNLFQITNGSPTALNPETAKSWNFTADYKPDVLPGLTVSASYFGVEYLNRIGTPTATSAQVQTVLQNPQIYGTLINHAPTAAFLAAQIALATSVQNQTGVTFNPQTQSVLSVFPGIVVFNNDTTNASSQSINGLDFAAKYDHDLGVGQIHVQFNAQKFLDFNQRLLANSTVASQINSIGLPADFKFRAGLGWSNDLIAAYTFANYVGAYQDIRVTPPGGVSSWTTIDLNVRLNLASAQSPIVLEGTTLDFTVTNLFDQRPPFTSPDSTGIIYDGANASPIGRYIGLRLSKNW